MSQLPTLRQIERFESTLVLGGVVESVIFDVGFLEDCVKLLFDAVDHQSPKTSRLRFQRMREDGTKLVLQLAGANASDPSMTRGDIALLRHYLKTSRETGSPMVLRRQVLSFTPSGRSQDDEAQLFEAADRIARTFATFTGRKQSFTFSLAASSLIAHRGGGPAQIDLCLSPSLFEMIRRDSA